MMERLSAQGEQSHAPVRKATTLMVKTPTFCTLARGPLRRFSRTVRDAFYRRLTDEGLDNTLTLFADCQTRNVPQRCAYPIQDDDSNGTNLFPAEFSRTLPNDVHAVLVPDRAGWHSAKALDVPANITFVLSPSIPKLCRRSNSTFARI
jgi:hypothetical protein